MRLLKCPRQESLFELVSIPSEVTSWKRWALRMHSATCSSCQKQIAAIRSNWETYFSPEPELASSLIKVYSRLQNDETLILKGWKLSEQRQRRSWGSFLLKEGWLFRGAISLGLGSLLVFFVVSQIKSNQVPEATVASGNPNVPFAQIRVEDKNRIQVHYVRPELLQSMEFETVSTR